MEGFTTDDDDKKHHKVRDHCHYTGKYKGAAHSIFNLRYNTPREISVIAHIASTYDYHLIIKELLSSLSHLVDNLSDGLHREKCVDCKCHLDNVSIKDNN